MWSELLQTHGYWVLALGCLLEGETMLVLAGFAAHRGVLDPVAVMGIAAVAGFTGDQFFFWLGRRHGAAMLARWPSIAGKAARVHLMVERWHELLIVSVRFAYGLRVAGPMLLGMSSLSAWRFAAFNALGALIWAVAMAGIGWLFGAAAEALLGRLQHLEAWLLVGLLAVLGMAALLRHRCAARKAK